LTPYHERFQIVFNISGYRKRPLAMRGAADAVQARLIGEHLDNDKMIAGGLRKNHFYIGDL
jgi:hypothetical protein